MNSWHSKSSLTSSVLWILWSDVVLPSLWIWPVLHEQLQTAKIYRLSQINLSRVWQLPLTSWKIWQPLLTAPVYVWRSPTGVFLGTLVNLLIHWLKVPPFTLLFISLQYIQAGLSALGLVINTNKTKVMSVCQNWASQNNISLAADSLKLVCCDRQVCLQRSTQPNKCICFAINVPL